MHVIILSYAYDATVTFNLFLLFVQSKLVCEYRWDRTVCGQDLVLLSLGGSLLDCNNFDADLRLLSHKVRESETTTISFLILIHLISSYQHQLDSGGIER